MADIIRRVLNNLLYKRFRDMLDGTHAEVISAVLPDGTAVQIVDGDGDRAGVDEIVNALQIMTVLHRQIHKGNACYVSFRIAALADDATLIFALTATTKSLHIIADASTGGNAEFDIFEDATITGGTATTVFNRNRTSDAVSTVTVVRDPTVNALGTNLDQQGIPGGRGGNASGGSGSVRHEWVLAPGMIYLYRITNRAGNAQFASLSIAWYEE